VGIYSAYLDNTYKTKNGTSHSTPMVSGAIALLKQAFPQASITDIRAALFNNALDLGVAGQDTRYGWGALDVSHALSALAASFASVTLNITRSDNELILSWPGSFSGFILEAKSCYDPGPNGWHALTNAVTVTGDINTAVLPLPASAQFYRLNWP
jgi:subtilisin family serine protease